MLISVISILIAFAVGLVLQKYYEIKNTKEEREIFKTEQPYTSMTIQEFDSIISKEVKEKKVSNINRDKMKNIKRLVNEIMNS